MVDYFYLPIKIGDQEVAKVNEHLAIKHGMPICIIDPNDKNYGENWNPKHADETTRVFGYLKIPYSQIDKFKGMLVDNGETDPLKYKPRTDILNVVNLDA
jgi:hypothetical protein